MQGRQTRVVSRLFRSKPDPMKALIVNSASFVCQGCKKIRISSTFFLRLVVPFFDARKSNQEKIFTSLSLVVPKLKHFNGYFFINFCKLCRAAFVGSCCTGRCLTHSISAKCHQWGSSLAAQPRHFLVITRCEMQ